MIDRTMTKGDHLSNFSDAHLFNEPHFEFIHHLDFWGKSAEASFIRGCLESTSGIIEHISWLLNLFLLEIKLQPAVYIDE